MEEDKKEPDLEEQLEIEADITIKNGELGKGKEEQKNNELLQNKDPIPDGPRTPMFGRNSSFSSSLLEFNTGLHCTSTPLNAQLPAHKYLNKFKHATGNLSTLVEENSLETSDKTISCSPEANKNKSIVEIRTIFPNDMNGNNINFENWHSINRDNLNNTVVYFNENDRILDEEDLAITKIDEYSVLFDNKDINELERDEEKELPISSGFVVESDNEPKPVEKNDEIQARNVPNNLQVFVSTNEQENRDNNHPEWEPLRNIKTDEERCQLIKARWESVKFPNQKSNSSAFSWYKKNGFGPFVLQRKRDIYKEKTFPHCKTGGSPNLFYEKLLKDAYLTFNSRSNLLDRKFGEKMNKLSWKQTNELRHSRRPLSWKHSQEVQRLVQQHREELHYLTLAYNERILGLNNAIKETGRVYDFLKMSYGTESSRCLPETLLLEKEEMQEYMDIDDMVTAYSEAYR